MKMHRIRWQRGRSGEAQAEDGAMPPVEDESEPKACGFLGLQRRLGGGPQQPNLPGGLDGPGKESTRVKVSVVIPVYNSETTLDHLCEQLVEVLSPCWGLQIILVDDGSSDGSGAVCQRLHERHPEMIAFVLLSRNFGEHNAVMAGLHYAQGDYCVIMADDLQNPPSEVPRLIAAIERGYDVVYVRYDPKCHSAFRNVASRLHNWMATRALNKPADLYLSSFKIMSRFLVREVIEYTGPDPYLDAIILRTTRNFAVVMARHGERETGASGYTLVKLFSLWGNMIVTFSVYPLRIAGLYGLVVALMGACYGGYTMLASLVDAIPDPDALEKLQASIWFFRGSTLLVLSILGEYVGRIYTHLNRVPQYVVRKEFLCRPRSSPKPPQEAALRL